MPSNNKQDIIRQLSEERTEQRKHRERTRRGGFITQIYILVAIGIVIVGVITYLTQSRLSTETVIERFTTYADDIGDEVTSAVKEYRAYEWLLRYWYEHAYDLDIEYDVDFETGVKTREKLELLESHNSGLQIKYISQEEVEALAEEDQKLYAEITYSWLITRINQIKRSYKLDFVFGVLTDTTGENAYKNQFFLFSGSDEGDQRGTEYLEVYPIGVDFSVADNKSIQNAMREAVENARWLIAEHGVEAGYDGHSAEAGAYMDYYSYLYEFDDHAVLIGLTYDLSMINRSIRNDTFNGTLIAMLYQLVLLHIVMLSIFILLLNPLKNVLKNIRRYTRTKDMETVSANLRNNMKGMGAYFIRRNEIGELSDEFIELMQEIEEYTDRIENITADRERIEADLELGARIQTSIMPSKFPPYPDRTEFDLFASMDPAREVGGDFYDFFLPDEDHLAMVIADVSGKGVPAALFMMATKIVINNQVSMRISPALALEMANNRICENNYEDMFVTVWLGILEISTGKLYCANAGHEYPTIMKPNGDFELYKDKHGFVIGGMTGVKYKEYVIQLEPGSKIFVYTDGVPEATNAETELFGTDRMIEALNKGKDGTPKEILHSVNEAVSEFVGEAEQFDDVTMLCMEYKGPGKKE